MSSGTGYLITTYDEQDEREDVWVHKNPEDAIEEVEVQQGSEDVSRVTIKEIGIYLGDDDRWVIER